MTTTNCAFHRPGPALDVDEEVNLLRASFDELSASLPDEIGDRVNELAKRIWPHRPRTHWVDQFSELTVLYPILQAEGLVEVNHRSARRACVAHLCFLIGAFGEDRLQDGQIAKSVDVFQSVRFVRSEGTRILRELRHENDSTSLLDAIGTSGTMLKPKLDGVDETSLAALAPLKAHFGFMATGCLLRYSNCSRFKHELSRDAFAKLSIGLQYADDAADWREDLPLADDNLLLVRLRDLGLDAYSLPDSDFRQINVGHALLRHDSIEDAKRKALSHIDDAIRIQCCIGCRTLVSQLELLKESIVNATPKIQDRIEREVLTACLMAAPAIG